MIYFIRHGQTDWNNKGLCQGQTDIFLNETGIAQAKELAEKLKGLTFDAVFCSPLTRAKQTLSYINLSQKTPIFYDKRIMERNFGELENTDYWALNQTTFWSLELNHQYQKAECSQNFYSRIENFYNDIKNNYAQKDVLIVAHGGVGKMTKRYFDKAMTDAEFVAFLPENGEILKFNY